MLLKCKTIAEPSDLEAAVERFRWKWPNARIAIWLGLNPKGALADAMLQKARFVCTIYKDVGVHAAVCLT